MSKKILLTVHIILLLASASFSQIYLNPGVDTTDTNIKAAVKFYENYIKEFKGKKLPDFNNYWNKEDCEKYKIPDPSVYGIGGDYPTYSMANIRTIHYVKPLKSGIINIKMTGGTLDSAKNLDVMYITNHYLQRNTNGDLKFIQPIQFFSESWQSKTVGPIKYFYPKYHRFNLKKAKSLITQIRKLESDWDVDPISMTYFFADTYDEIQLIRGFDFTMGIGNADKPMGISNPEDRLVFCAGNGENYFHEIVHIYLNPIHQKSPLNEGLAVFYGGSLGNQLDWHLVRLKDYLNKHPEINLNKLDDFYYMDNYTNPSSAIQGLICKLVFEKDGISGLKRLMKTYTSLDEIFQKEFNLDVKNLNQGLRALINRQ